MRRTLWVLVALGIPALLLAVAVGAGAERTVGPKASPVLGPELRISGPNATSNDYFPAVAWSQAGDEFLAVWQDGRNLNSRGWDIYGRRVGADGAGPELRISGAGAISEDSHPTVAWNQTAGEYLVVWGDYRDDLTGGSDIYGRRVGTDGARLGADIRISGTNNASWEEKPAVAWNQVDNGYLVVWQDWRNVSTSGANIYGRRVGDGGAGIGGDFLISGPNTTNDYNPAAAWNQADSEYLVVWQDERNLSTRGADIYGRRVTP
jgi:hypothetical protein